MQAEFRLALQARNPARNLHRAWMIEAGRDLFGAWLVHTRFGRIGTEGRLLVRSFGDETEAHDHIAAMLRRRAGSARRNGAPYLPVDVGTWDRRCVTSSLDAGSA